MKIRVGSGVIIAVLWCGQAVAQVGVWKNYTSMQDVRAVARSGNTVWAATTGGMFSWTEGSASFSRFTNAEGLKSIDLTAIGVDNNGDIWSGSSTGMLHVYSPQKNTWRYVPDISTANQTDKRINELAAFGDTVFISTNFGLSVFRVNRFQFGDTYTKFGAFIGNVRVAVSSAVVFDGKIWAAVSTSTASRVAWADLSNPNLLPPEAWTLQVVGNSSTRVRTLTLFNNRLYAATTTGLYAYDGSSWNAIDSLAGKNLLALHASASVLATVDDAFTVYTLSAQNVVSRYGDILPSSPTAVIVSTDNKPIVATREGGLLTYTTTWTSHFPNGPFSNQFLSVAVDDNGTVWGASGNQTAKGFYRFNGSEWKSFHVNNNPALPTNDCYRVSIGCNGERWISTWGRGVILMPPGVDTVLAENVFGTNVGMKGIPWDTTYVVTGSVTCDAQGKTWVPLLLPYDDRTIAVRRPNGTWTTFPVYVGGVKATYLTDITVDRALTIDPFGNLWAAIPVAGPLGVVNLNNKGNAPDSIADFHLTTNTGLPSNVIRTIVVDRDGDVWIGTDRGIAIVLDPSNPTRSGAVAGYKPLNGITINAIAVDPLNQKWVATNEGAVLLSRDGTQALAQYTVENTDGKIISNEIKSIAVDGRTGTVYFGTTNGLASFTTTAAEPKTSFDQLTISPNPYRIPNVVPLTIDGLVENSMIKILTVDGSLVRDMTTPGGRIGFWDGKDETGRYVASGIYIVVAYSETNKDKVGTGKVAVIRN